MNMIEEIKKLKKEKEAIILAHYYVNDELQEVADYVGDSYYLSKVAKNTDAKEIIFAGVKFMGESAKILNFDKKVYVLDDTATCPMAHMATVKKILEMREQYEDLAVVCYINSTMELKKYSDVCVTSANAVKICKALPNKNIFFIPDQNLGNYVKEHVTEKNVILNDGFCPIHHHLKLDLVKELKKDLPNAVVLAHPECRKAILAEADFIGSTSMIINAVKNYDCDDFIVLTENGVIHELRNQYPDKKFHEPKEKMVCQDMKKNTLEQLLNVLRHEQNEIIISKEDRDLALKPLEEMLKYAK